MGVVTDRDLVRRGVARGLPFDARIDAVMTTPVVTIPGHSDLQDAYAIFRAHAVRRLVVVDHDQRFIGMISVDDLLVEISANLADLVRPVSSELLFPQRDSGVPALL